MAEKLFEKLEGMVNNSFKGDDVTRQHIIVNLARLTNLKRWYEELFTNFNGQSEVFGQSLNRLKDYKEQYIKYRIEVEKQGIDVSLLPIELNYLDIRN